MHFKDRAMVADGNLVSFNAGILTESGFMQPHINRALAHTQPYTQHK